LAERAGSVEMEKELAYWREVDSARMALAERQCPGRDLVSRVRKLRKRLSREDTERLVRQARAGGKSRVEEVLVGALVRVLGKWRRDEEVVIEMEGHGRGAVAGDVSRTVGWFTSFYPVRLRSPAGATGVEVLKTVKAELRAVPRGGTGYGMLRYSREGARLTGERLVSLNYLGQIGESSGAEDLFEWAVEEIGEMRSREARRRYELELDAVIVRGELEVVWSYSKEELEEVGREYIMTLKEMIADSEQAEYLASDFPDADLSQAKLDSAIAEMERG
jgi:non-ribosomal peptide synthase protein (TIGR01720 family)